MVLLAVLALAAVFAHRADGARGLAGAGTGAAVGLLMAFVSRFFTRRARSANGGLAGGKPALAALYVGMTASFVILIGTILAVHFLWRPLVNPVALTALAVYLVFRLGEAARAWPLRRPCGCTTTKV
jgi:MFS family permease